MVLRLFQECGHQPIILLGNGTTKIGDPSGKDATRPLQTAATIEKNAAAIEKIFKRFLRFEGQNKALIRYNDDWLKGLNYVDFLRDIGRHFSINRMLQADSVRLRLEREQHLSFLEFNYMVVQAYDFYQLAKQDDCRLQMGGSDQWGNITAGIELNRRLGAKPLYGLTTPLLETREGAKMGKTEQGALWLAAEKLAPWDYWQFWRNCHDDDVERFLKLFTTLPLKEIAALTQEGGIALNDAKKILASHATQLCHSKEDALKAEQTAATLFEGGTTAAAQAASQRHHIAKDAPPEQRALIYVLTQSNMTKSNSEARRLIQGGGIKIDGVTIKDERHILKDAKQHTITVGKKRMLTVHCDDA